MPNPDTPLAQDVEAKSLDVLFETDPEELTEDDMRTIVLAFREGRKRWHDEETKAKTQGRRVKPSQGMKTPKLNEFNLSADELLGDL